MGAKMINKSINAPDPYMNYGDVDYVAQRLSLTKSENQRLPDKIPAKIVYH